MLDLDGHGRAGGVEAVGAAEPRLVDLGDAAGPDGDGGGQRGGGGGGVRLPPPEPGLTRPVRRAALLPHQVAAPAPAPPAVVDAVVDDRVEAEDVPPVPPVGPDE